MSLELRVSGGALDGHRASFEQERVLIGRDPHADVRFDAEHDREVSTRHAEIRRVDGRFLLRDLNSTNGTFLNGSRLSGERAVRDGDHIGCGKEGPVLTVSLTGADFATAGAATVVAPGRARTAPPAAGASAPRRRPAILAALAAAAAVVAVGAGGWIALGRDTGTAPATVPPDSAALAVVDLGRPTPALDTTAGSPAPATVSVAPTPSAGATATPSAAATAAAAEMDYTSVVAANGAAIVLVAVEMPGGERSTGTAFAVNRNGLLVTNRHVVSDGDGVLPTRVAVLFANTDAWLPARVVRVHETLELATLQVESEGPFPAVRGLAAPGTQPPVGSPVALLGYPLGMDLPMDRSEVGTIAAASLFRGMVSKNVRGMVQIDAYAGHGSSGSPVFDRRGAVVGVVYGGPREGGGRIVYAVSADELLAFLPESAARRVR